MAFVVGTGQNLATRWANTLELQKCLLGPVSIPAGTIELGIDYAQCPHFTGPGGLPLYCPIDVGSSISNIYHPSQH